MKDVHTFTSTSGITFSLEEDVVIGVNGYAYAKVRCDQEGLDTNVDPLSVNKVNPIPTGHLEIGQKVIMTIPMVIHLIMEMIIGII